MTTPETWATGTPAIAARRRALSGDRNIVMVNPDDLIALRLVDGDWVDIVTALAARVGD